ncbi:thiol reductant ABC exporter subunit CydD [Paenibacillus sp. 481]|uniref:thiol reductant ABC exporter subunit CydD n=1 Tax=Paenibacillus sp. 481 TaxID=2835869 RepID=UPI001E624BDC|nr:thiol reductant ABC exporter subunit CydD [Paenibacillus sp. 481]UHA75495.1 thiol reductant ABC exporter subunit CydD [Paenibacillus sp. 481]
MSKHGKHNLLNYKGIKPVLLVMTLLTLVHSASIIAVAIGLADVVSALFAGESLEEQASSIGLFVAGFVVRQVTALIQQKVAYRYAEGTARELRRKLMDKLFQFGPRFAQTEGTGNIVTLVLDGVTQFRTYLELFIPRMVGTAITPLVVLGYVCMRDQIAALILAVTMPILLVFMILVGLAAKKHMDQQWKSYRVLSNHFVDSLRGLETLKFLGQSRAHSDMIGRVSDQYRSATMRTLRVAFLSSFALDFFTMLSVASVAVSLGLRLIEGQLMLDTALLVLILAPEYFLPVRMVGADYHATLKGKEAGKAIESIIGREDKGGSDVYVRASTADNSTSKTDVSGLTWTKESSLVLHNIGVQHEQSGRASLCDVSIEIKGMSKVGIIGASGAGKSTLIDVLSGFIRPTSGHVEWKDGKVGKDGGVPDNALTDAEWRKLTTYIPQHPYVFHSSVADNVRFYAQDASPAEVERAIQAAGLAEVVAGLPNGCDELIGNGGRQLSGGQEQRIALARACLSDRPIMLLDEPTAHLDIETECELKDTMLNLFADKLVLLATHRLHWMPDMDFIIVLDEGQIAETGTHEQLLASRGVYYDLIMTQTEGMEIQ